MEPETSQNQTRGTLTRFISAWHTLDISDRVFPILSIAMVLAFFAIIGIWIEGWDIKLVLIATSALVIFDFIHAIAGQTKN